MTDFKSWPVSVLPAFATLICACIKSVFGIVVLIEIVGAPTVPLGPIIVPPLTVEKYSQAQFPVPPAPAVRTENLATVCQGWFADTAVAPLTVVQGVAPPMLVETLMPMFEAVEFMPVTSTASIAPAVKEFAGITQLIKVCRALLFAIVPGPMDVQPTAEPTTGMQLVVVAPPSASKHSGAASKPEMTPELSSLESVPCTPVPVAAPLRTGVETVGEVIVGVLMIGLVSVLLVSVWVAAFCVKQSQSEVKPRKQGMSER